MKQDDYDRLQICCGKPAIVHINNDTHLTTRISCQVCDMWVSGDEQEAMITLWNDGIVMKELKESYE